MITRDVFYEEYLASYLNERLPDLVYDGHFHIRGDRYLEQGITAGTYVPYLSFVEETLGKCRPARLSLSAPLQRRRRARLPL